VNVHSDWKESRITESSVKSEHTVPIPKKLALKPLLNFLSPNHHEQVRKILAVVQSVNIETTTAQQGQALLDPIFLLEAYSLYPSGIVQNRLTSNDVDVCVWKPV